MNLSCMTNQLNFIFMRVDPPPKQKVKTKSLYSIRDFSSPPGLQVKHFHNSNQATLEGKAILRKKHILYKIKLAV